ncbi:thrombospondin type 3 repeat-containing protein [Candidatus Uhrbacteria bacterium]|nr:thrombospondin type 3 repeat-containing protein [Candidatus Uhrbacteria bacterium]
MQTKWIFPLLLSLMFLLFTGCTTLDVTPPGGDVTLDSDFDDDLVDDGVDNCPELDNADQANWDGDMLGDVCDDDDDNDGFLDPVDNCQLMANDQADIDGDFYGDACDMVDDTACRESVPVHECDGGWVVCEPEPIADVPVGHVIRVWSTSAGGALYWLGADGRRYVFPNEATYRSWYPVNADCPVIRQISEADMRDIPIGGNVTMRPGVHLLKITTDPALYAVSRGGVLHRLDSEATAEALYGLGWWREHTVDVPDVFFVNYTIGSPIFSASDYDPFAEFTGTDTIDQDLGLTP